MQIYLTFKTISNNEITKLLVNPYLEYTHALKKYWLNDGAPLPFSDPDQWELSEAEYNRLKKVLHAVSTEKGHDWSQKNCHDFPTTPLLPKD